MAKVLIGNFKGPKGDKGDKGDPGTAASIQVGTTQTVQPEENAEVTNTGTTTAAVLNFKIPRGADGMTDLTAEYSDASEYTCQPTANAPVVVKELDGKTEQGENPSPDNPQVIKGVGGMGCFDGAWRQGSYNISGVPDTSGAWISFVNKIPCKANDNIKVSYDKDIVGIRIFFWNTSGGFLSTEPIDGKETTGWTAPATAGSFVISFNDNNISPALAAYCTVTINGEYQTGVEVTGENWFNIDGDVNTQGNNYSGVDRNTVSGNVLTSNADRAHDYAAGQIIKGLKGKKVTFSAKVISFGTGSGAGILIIENGSNNNSSQDTNIINSTIKVAYTVSTENPVFAFITINGTGAQFTDIQVEIGETNTDYTPYHHTALSIPLTSPLHEGDKLCYVKPGESYVGADSDTVVADRILYGCYRENATVVFDGSEDEGWILNTETNDFGQYTIIGASGILSADGTLNASTGGISSNFGVSNQIGAGNEKSGAWIYNSTTVALVLPKDLVEYNVSALKTWLSTNPLTVVYRLAQPYFEPFTDQNIFYTLRTDDTLSYVYSNDPIEPVLTVEVAKNSTGGYLLESYTQAQKNAISEANSQSRLSAIEQQLVNQATTPTE